MKHLLLGLSLTLLAGTAYAADAIVDEVVVVESPFNWSGVYIGANVGYGWGDTDYDSGGNMQPGDVPFEIFEHFQDEEGDGVLGGLQVGFNWQAGNLVYGLEADAAIANADSSQIFFTSNGDLYVDEEMQFFGTVRGRLGYAFDRFLPYVTGGLAVANYELSTPIGDSGYSDDKTLLGWTVGVGGEVAVTDRVSLKLEYLYADFQDETYDVIQNVGSYTMPVEISPSVQVVRFGVNYRF
jgi:outer membrane immunogenic protein